MAPSPANRCHLDAERRAARRRPRPRTTLPCSSCRHGTPLRSTACHPRGRPATRSRRWWLGGGTTALALFAGTATAAATGLLPLPGATEITTISTTTTGTDTIDLGATPDDANGVVLSLRCLTPGRFSFPDGSSLGCSSIDFGTGTEPGIAPSLFPLSNVIDGSVQITTSPDARLSITATHATETTTDWATDEQGQSCGVINENGEPYLIAVTADDGRQGYVRR